MFAVMSAVLVSFTSCEKKQKVVYVRSLELVEQFEGHKEAKADFEIRKKGWQANLDSLQADFKRAENKYQLEMTDLSEGEKKAKENILARQHQNLRQYAEVLDQKAAEEDQKLVNGILKQIDDFVTKYCEEKDYDIVIGTTNTGNLMYGKKELDITEELIKAINVDYLSE
jgi:outer membrane protein